jgi:hypothetical protein
MIHLDNEYELFYLLGNETFLKLISYHRNFSYCELSPS